MISMTENTIVFPLKEEKTKRKKVKNKNKTKAKMYFTWRKTSIVRNYHDSFIISITMEAVNY